MIKNREIYLERQNRVRDLFEKKVSYHKALGTNYAQEKCILN